MSTVGGRFDFDDGGTYAGGWEDGKANGYGVCTGPKGQGEYAGLWHMGFETSGVYTWSSGNNFKGQWMQGKRHGVGVEVKGNWVYHGEWTQGFKGRYGVRQSTLTGAKYEGTWTTGLQDGYGVETYADEGIYQGQWLRGIRHGYGLRQSVPYGLAARHQQKTGRESLTSLRSEHEEDNVVKDRDRKLDEKRGGFVLTALKSDDIILPFRKPSGGSAGGKTSSRSSIRKTIVEGLKLRKQKSTGDIQDTSGRLGAGGSVRSAISNISHESYGSFQSSDTNNSVQTNSNASFTSLDDVTDVNMIETYTGEWKSDKRSGFGISERSDGLKYEGEWEGNKRHGYGSTTFRDGTKEEGKYKNNVIISSGRKSKLFMLRASKLRDRVQNAVAAARSAAQIALQKSDIAVSRMTTARSKAELALVAANKAQSDAEKARPKAAEYAPDFMKHAIDKSAEQVPIRSPLLSFGEHYDAIESPRPKPQPRPPLPTLAAKSILQRVANIAGVDKSHEPRKPPPSIASALVSVAMDSSAPLMKNINQRGKGLGGGLAIGLGGLAVGLGGGFRALDNSSVQPSSPSATVSEASAVEGNISESTGVGGSAEQNAERSDLLNAKIIDDHFDQYQTWSRPSTVSTHVENYRRPRNPFSSREPSIESREHDGGRGGGIWGGEGSTHRTNSPLSSERTDSGISSTDISRPLSTMSRRQTLTESHEWGPSPPASIRHRKEPPSRTSTSGQGLVKLNGGLNYLVKAVAQPPVAASRAAYPPIARTSGGLRKATSNLGSLPDVAEVTTTAGQNPMSREEVHLMSLRRREEIRRQREEEARRRRDEVVLSFSEFKEWCRERQLVVLVLAVNISLATMFFNLLSY